MQRQISKSLGLEQQNIVKVVGCSKITCLEQVHLQQVTSQINQYFRINTEVCKTQLHQKQKKMKLNSRPNNMVVPGKGRPCQ